MTEDSVRLYLFLYFFEQRKSILQFTF